MPPGGRGVLNRTPVKTEVSHPWGGGQTHVKHWYGSDPPSSSNSTDGVDPGHPPFIKPRWGCDRSNRSEGPATRADTAANRGSSVPLLQRPTGAGSVPKVSLLRSGLTHRWSSRRNSCGRWGRGSMRRRRSCRSAPPPI